MKKVGIYILIFFCTLAIGGCKKSEVSASSSYAGILMFKGETYVWRDVQEDIKLGEQVLAVLGRVDIQETPQEGQSNFLNKGTPVYAVENQENMLSAIDANGQYLLVKKEEKSK